MNERRTMVDGSLGRIRPLTEARQGLHVSLYLPVEQAGRETRQNPIRFKNLLREAERQLEALDVRDPQEFLQPAWELEQDLDFWEGQERDAGLAVFIAPGFFDVVWLPIEVEEMAVVSGRFHVKPLVRVLSESRPFYLLAVSLNDVRFFRCTPFSMREMKVEGMPRSMAEALWAEDPQAQAQFRSLPAGQAAGKQGTFGAFHGSGDIVSDEAKDRILRYFQAVDRALEPVLARSEAPLVLASVEYLQPIFARASRYRHLVTPGVTGNPEEAQPEELRDKAWQLVSPLFEKERREVLERYGAARGRNLTAEHTKDILDAAESGRVDVLLFVPEVELWGVRLNGDLLLHQEQQPGDEDLIDLAVTLTLRNNGGVYAVSADELPGGFGMAALLRY